MREYETLRANLLCRSVWGLLGATVVLANALLDMFGFPPGNLGVLMLLNELFLRVWLIVKGFNPSAIASPPCKTEMNGV